MTLMTGVTTADGGTLIEVAPNHSWTGRITLSATQTALNSGTVATPSVEVDTAQAGTLPPDGTEIISFLLALPTLNLLGVLQSNTPVVETVYDVFIAVPTAGTQNAKLVLRFNGAGAAKALAFGDYN